MFKSIEQQSAVKDIINQIKSAILRGELQMGDRLNERALCAELNVSRTPVREAFRILQTQNVLTYSPHYGVRVKELSQKYIDDVWAVRDLLESYAIKEVTLKLDDNAERELKRYQDIMNAPFQGSMLDFNEIDSSFHLALARLSGNEQLQLTIETIWNSILLCRSRLFLGDRRVRDSFDEHNQVIEAILSKDVDGAVRAWQKHLKNAIDAVRINNPGAL